LTVAPTATSTPPPTATSTATATPVSTATPTMSAAAGFRVVVHLHNYNCDGDLPHALELTLAPTDRTALTIGGFATFENVPPGEYLVDVPLFCSEEFPCLPDKPVTVTDRDVLVEICYENCPSPRLEPSSGPPGTQGGVGGRCYYLHSGRRGYVFFDDQLVGQAGPGDTIGNFGGSFAVPADATLGPHTISVSLSPDNPNVSSTTAVFTVTAAP
jgi:hypothetical protein